MSGAQAKAVVICGCIGVIAEVGSKKKVSFCFLTATRERSSRIEFN